MTEHVTTISELVNAVYTNKIPSASSVLTIVKDTSFFDVYVKEHKAIDNILKTRYGNFVIPHISNPYESASDAFEDMSLVSNEFISAYEQALTRLWSLETVDFDPIENYDRREEWTDVKNGSEIDTGNISTEENGQEDIGASKETNVSELGKRTNTSEETQGKTSTDTTSNVTNTNQTNQTSTTKNTGTSYNTNLYDTTTVTMSGNPNTETGKLEQNVSTDAVNNTKTDIQNSVTDTNTITTDAKVNAHSSTSSTNEDRKHVYDAIEDVHTGRVHGNIGVTTAVKMMSEFSAFYQTYNFWCTFWDMYVSMFASPIFDTERTTYEGV